MLYKELKHFLWFIDKMQTAGSKQQQDSILPLVSLSMLTPAVSFLK